MNATRKKPFSGAPSARTLPVGLALALALALGAWGPSSSDRHGEERADEGTSLEAPAHERIPVAFLISRGATVIDWSGPWEVFQDVMVTGRGASHAEAHPFELFTVAESREPIRGSGGIQIIPDYTFEDAPQPRVIVVPAQGGVTPAMLDWLRQAAAEADVTMSVCTGAFILARAGLLDGSEATTHHEFLNQFERRYPQVRLRRDVRWVEGPRVATAAGLTSGIDLALRTVARYFGPETAGQTAEFMEHHGDGWQPEHGHVLTSADAAEAVVAAPPRGVLQGLDPVHLTRGHEVSGDPSIAEEYEGYRYHFADRESREEFRTDPDRYAIQFHGACAAMANRGGRPGDGDVDRFLVYDGRIYIFASEHCRRDFQADPVGHLAASKAG